jgi:exonuclease III
VLKYPKEFLEFDYQFYDDLDLQHDLENFFRRLHPDRTEYSYFSHADSGFRIDHCTVRPRSPQRHSVTDL